ncbi:pre-rRNA 2'-O-ribose RNA methyltransferase [Ricinus communis]|uniref:Putative rRNA methyltransferase n=1 Tax=Ricinus communis TaxID=3988 RepID=B9RH61_RICCO|nr:pre-rRNA 2'-O-ribose RNA methyltransferase [Ricinus communis]EEF49423.1 ribosomal RNA methyltransferase, putative [Ricinus communis]|eukprot:XP_002512920.1 putative rRNA methyltransferase [Ricinus communis]
MGKVKGKHRLDKFYRLAKEHGYRSRASWKLVQLDSKFQFLHSSRAVLDLCAAPGGWMQVAVQRVPVGSLVLGIDLVKIAPIRGATSIEQDITKPECKARVKKIMGEHGVKAFDLVLHDGSPNIGGAWAQEAMSQNALVIDAVRLATQFLAPKGTFVTKVFRSQDYNSVIYCLNQLFEKVEVDKPAASRSASAEIFVLGLKYKAPAKIDPRLLDVKHLFQGSVEPQRKVIDVLRGSKQKRHRDGYEDGESIIRKVSSAADFVWSDTPLEILGSVTSIAFEDPASLPLRDHALTTEEVKALCDDLRVLGKQDFKHLLKWRMHIRKALSPSQKATSTTSTDGEEKNVEDEDDKLLNEMEELTYAVERKKKQAKKRDAKRRAKDKARKTKGVQIDALEDGYVDHELFSLSSIKGKKDLVAVNSAENDENGELGDSENEEPHDQADEHTSSDLDSDEERRRYDAHLEEFLDQVYERFVTKREGSTKQRKRAKKAYSELMEGDDNDDAMQSDYDSDKDQGDEEVNPLMVPFNDGEVPTQEEITNKWFTQDVFAKAVEDGDLEKYDSEDQMQVDMQEGKVASPKNKAKDAIGHKHTQHQTSKGEEDFEIVPAPAMDSSDDSSSDDSDEDVEAKAEILAYAKKMLRKKQREEMLDDAYNKYMFDDEGLPGWFVEEERRHRQPIKPVTKEEIVAMRAQFKEINARPAKKVAEAKARKKRIAMKRLEKVRKKANTISDQAEISDRSKRKMIEQLYKKAQPKRPKKEYVVAKKGVANKAGKGKVLVDRRMKKDARVHGMSKRGKGNSKGGKNAKGQKSKGPRNVSAKNGKKGKKGKTAE